MNPNAVDSSPDNGKTQAACIGTASIGPCMVHKTVFKGGSTGIPVTVPLQ